MVRGALTCLVLCLAVAHAGIAQHSAASTVRDLIGAINSGDSATIASFAAARYHPAYLARSGGVDRAVRRWLEIHETYGPLIVDTVLHSTTSYDARVWVRGSISHGWLDFRAALDTASGAVTRIGLGRGVRPDHRTLRHPPLTDVALRAHLREYLEAMAEADLFSGSVLVARGDSVIYAGAFGFADQARGIRNGTETRYDLASVGKVFTAVAVARLVAEGRLSLDDTLSRFRTGLPAHVARRITIAQLLSHTSGLGELGPELDAAMAQTRTVADMMRLIGDTTLAFEPGSTMQYSNRGYIVLGAVIEAVSGQDYFEHINQRVFRQAGMTGARFISDGSGTPYAVRYSRFPTLRTAYVPGRRAPTAARLDLRGGPAGGAFATVGDLHRFIRALESGRFVSKELTRQLVTPRPDLPWGLGFQGLGDGGYGHRGAAPGATAYLFRLATGHTVVVLSNYDSAAHLVGDYIRERVGN